MTAHNLLIRLVSEVFAGNYEGPLYAPHPDLKEKRAELGLPTPESVNEIPIAYSFPCGSASNV